MPVRTVTKVGTGGGAAIVTIGPEFGGPPLVEQQALSLGAVKKVGALPNVIETLAGRSNRLNFGGPTEAQTLSSLFQLTKLNGVLPNVVQTLALLKATFDTNEAGATATPDTDPHGDTFVKQAGGAAEGANGNMQARIASAAPGSDAQVSIMEADFTRFGTMTAMVGGIHTTNFLTLRISHNGLAGADTLNYTLSTMAARPFTESTQVWPRPATGTALKAGTISVAQGAAAFYTITLTDAQLNSLLGNWLYVELTSGSALATIIFTAITRNTATAANRPRFRFDLKA